MLNSCNAQQLSGYYTRIRKIWVEALVTRVTFALQVVWVTFVVNRLKWKFDSSVVGTMYLSFLFFISPENELALKVQAVGGIWEIT